MKLTTIKKRIASLLKKHYPDLSFYILIGAELDFDDKLSLSVYASSKYWQNTKDNINFSITNMLDFEHIIKTLELEISNRDCTIKQEIEV